MKICLSKAGWVWDNLTDCFEAKHNNKDKLHLCGINQQLAVSKCFRGRNNCNLLTTMASAQNLLVKHIAKVCLGLPLGMFSHFGVYKLFVQITVDLKLGELVLRIWFPIATMPLKHKGSTINAFHQRNMNDLCDCLFSPQENTYQF